ncbi:DMT family transporter [Rhizobium sp. YIM 134829]|uniref:DMT family transporter n=1 Tax=Rhizobium sp. YIM 134829 TaxID=3390453 RepID=UPI00397C83B2
MAAAEPRAFLGIALACAGYACFALQDAIVKLLVVTYAVPQILFMRSLVIVVIALPLARFLGHSSIMKSKHRGTLVLRAALMLAAWLLFYNAARHLGLGELTTLYFSAPIIVILLSIVVLKEEVNRARWLSCIGGFIGVAVAANPTQAPSLIPALMCILAGAFWAWSTVLVRLVSKTETTLVQMGATSLLFALACALSFPWVWKTPDFEAWMLMIGLGLVAALGQYLLYEGFRHAPASALAPVEYTGLIWAFLYGYAIWAEVPSLTVVLGACLIVASSGILVFGERRRIEV